MPRLVSKERCKVYKKINRLNRQIDRIQDWWKKMKPIFFTVGARGMTTAEVAKAMDMTPDGTRNYLWDWESFGYIRKVPRSSPHRWRIDQQL